MVYYLSQIPWNLPFIFSPKRFYGFDWIYILCAFLFFKKLYFQSKPKIFRSNQASSSVINNTLWLFWLSIAKVKFLRATIESKKLYPDNWISSLLFLLFNCSWWLIKVNSFIVLLCCQVNSLMLNLQCVHNEIEWKKSNQLKRTSCLIWSA